MEEQVNENIDLQRYKSLVGEMHNSVLRKCMPIQAKSNPNDYNVEESALLIKDLCEEELSLHGMDYEFNDEEVNIAISETMTLINALETSELPMLLFFDRVAEYFPNGYIERMKQAYTYDKLNNANTLYDLILSLIKESPDVFVEGSIPYNFVSLFLASTELWSSPETKGFFKVMFSDDVTTSDTIGGLLGGFVGSLGGFIGSAAGSLYVGALFSNAASSKENMRYEEWTNCD